MTDQPLRILFLCTGNSCRSQMAEAYARSLGGDRVQVRSAGIEAHGQNARAIQVMGEVGLDLRGQTSDVVTEAWIADSDLVVTVCGHADEQCPVLPPHVQRVHWPLPDPARTTGSEDDILDVFRRVRGEIERRVHELLQQHHALNGGNA